MSFQTISSISYVLQQKIPYYLLTYAAAMDRSPLRQTFKFENNFSTIGKSFLNLVKLWSLVVKYCKMSKI